MLTPLDHIIEEEQHLLVCFLHSEGMQLIDSNNEATIRKFMLVTPSSVPTEQQFKKWGDFRS